MTRAWLSAALLLSVGGCSFGIDPESVPPPKLPCVPSCENKVCDDDNGCGEPCVAAGAIKGCVRRTHQVIKGRIGVGGETASAPGGHSIRGRVTFGAASSTQTGGGGHELSGVLNSP